MIVVRSYEGFIPFLLFYGHALEWISHFIPFLGILRYMHKRNLVIQCHAYKQLLPLLLLFRKPLKPLACLDEVTFSCVSPLPFCCWSKCLHFVCSDNRGQCQIDWCLRWHVQLCIHLLMRHSSFYLSSAGICSELQLLFVLKQPFTPCRHCFFFLPCFFVFAAFYSETLLDVSSFLVFSHIQGDNLIRPYWSEFLFGGA